MVIFDQKWPKKTKKWPEMGQKVTLRIPAPQWDPVQSIEHSILAFWKSLLPTAGHCSTLLKVFFDLKYGDFT